LLSEIQNGLPPLSEMPQALTRLESWTAATPGKSDTRLVCKTMPDEFPVIGAASAEDATNGIREPAAASASAA